MAARLRAIAKLVGPASVPGELLNFGYYPAAVLGERAGARIHGEIYRLMSPRVGLHMLDIYEGCSAADPTPWLYRREIVAAQLFSSRSVLAWIYILNQTPRRRVPLPLGRHVTRNAKSVMR